MSTMRSTSGSTELAQFCDLMLKNQQEYNLTKLMNINTMRNGTLGRRFVLFVTIQYMKLHSRLIIHLGVNYIIFPRPLISQQTLILFQNEILKSGLEFSNVLLKEGKIIVTRESPTNLQINVSTFDPQVGQLLILAPNPQRSLELFIQEAEASVNAFSNTWPAANRQIINCDAAIRELHETTSEHAFQELWEKRLGQSPETLTAFDRPIRGGGLRFIMEPSQDEVDPARIEVKIESSLNDTKKIFVETQFFWLQPTSPGSPFPVRNRLDQINSYIESKVHAFIIGDSK